MNKPHKHAELIKQWADGAEIEFLDPLDNEWNLTIKPQWAEDVQYRVAPKLKTFSVKLTKIIEVIVDAENYLDASKKASRQDHRCISNATLWSRVDSQVESVSQVVE